MEARASCTLGITMIEQLINYLKRQLIPFRLLSFPSPEPLPEVAFPRPQLSQIVEAQVLLAGGRPVLACIREGDHIDYACLSREIGAVAIDGANEDLPPAFRGVAHLPPVGGMLGMPVLVDARVLGTVVVFRAFGADDFVELVYDDFVRVERARVAVFAIAGELPPAEETAQPGQAGSSESARAA
jgi:hypothetical protein